MNWWNKLTQDNKVKLVLFVAAMLFAVIDYFFKISFDPSKMPVETPQETEEKTQEPEKSLKTPEQLNLKPIASSQSVKPFTESPPGPGQNVCDIGKIRVKLTGQHENNVWIGFPNGVTHSDAIHDGKWYKCGQDVTSNGSNLVVVRYGKNRDAHNLYGLNNSGVVVKLNIRIHDGRSHAVSIEGNEYHIVFGKKHDLLRIVKFDGNQFIVTRIR